MSPKMPAILCSHTLWIISHYNIRELFLFSAKKLFIAIKHWTMNTDSQDMQFFSRLISHIPKPTKATKTWTFIQSDACSVFLQQLTETRPLLRRSVYEQYSRYWMEPAFEAIRGHKSAHSFATGPVIAEPANHSKHTYIHKFITHNIVKQSSNQRRASLTDSGMEFQMVGDEWQKWHGIQQRVHCLKSPTLSLCLLILHKFISVIWTGLHHRKGILRI